MIVKVCGVLGSDEGDLKEITLFSSIVRHGQTASGWPCLVWEADQSHVVIITESLGLSRAEATKTLCSLGIKRSVVNQVTDLSDERAGTYRSVCRRNSFLAQDRPDIFFTAREMARWMSQASFLSWEMAKRCGSYWQAGNDHADSRLKPCEVLAKVHHRACSQSRKTYNRGSVNSTDRNIVVQ